MRFRVGIGVAVALLAIAVPSAGRAQPALNDPTQFTSPQFTTPPPAAPPQFSAPLQYESPQALPPATLQTYTVPEPTAPAELPPAAAAPEAAPHGMPPSSTADDVQSTMRQAEQDDRLSPEQKKALADLSLQTLEELRKAEEQKTKCAQYDAARRNAPRELERLKAEMTQRTDDALPEIDQLMPLDAMKDRFDEAERRRAAARSELQALEAEQVRRTQRWDEVPELDERAARREVDLAQKIEGTAAGEGNGTARAARQLLEAQRANASTERATYAAELACYEATRELLRLRLDDAVRRVNHAEKQTQRWKDAVEARAQAKADAEVKNARWALIMARPETVPLAEENERLTQLRQGPVSPAARLKALRGQVTVAQAQVAKLRSEFARVKQTAELSSEIGQLLLNQRRLLPDTAEMEDAAQARKEEIAAVKLELLNWENRRSELADVEAAVRDTLAPLESALAEDECDELGVVVRELLTARRGYLDDLIADQNALFNAYVLDLDRTEQELLQMVQTYQAYIDEQILWVRSFPPTTGWSPTELTLAAARLTAADDWLQLPTRLYDDMRASPQTWMFAVPGYLTFLWLLRRMRQRIARLGATVQRSYAAGFTPTIRVVLLTTLCALPAPAILWFLAMRLVAWPGTTDFVRAFSGGMKTTAVAWLTIALVRQALRRQGLAEAHFGYPSLACAQVRGVLWRMAAIGIPASFAAAWAEGLGSVPIIASVGRAAFILGMLCLCRAVQVIAHPDRGLMPMGRDDDEVDEFHRRLRRIWYAAACIVPLIPALLSASGYHYTALQLSLRIDHTVWVLLAFSLVRSLLMRALITARQRLLMEQARHPAATDDSAAATKPNAPAMTLAAIDRQSRSLVNGFGALALALGVWWVWADMLPAVKFLDRWQLYSNTVTTSETTTNADGSLKTQEVTRLRWITAANFVRAAIILLMATIIGRNLPGLLEIACLQWLPIDSGARYAATTVARYVIHLATIIAVCHAVGLQWASIQWLAAAVTVGLGFGLQEIFANFISGLILLFERPIRVGDTVTIGDVTGRVSRIRSRATTIVDGDRKELIVPNKEFITGKLMNWTLSDDVLRTVVRIGLNHDADVPKAARLLRDIATRNALVLRDPEPSVVCTKLGEQLEIELGVFSKGMSSLSPLRHSLNVAVLEGFHEAGISLACSQREIVLRSYEATGAPVTTTLPVSTERKAA